MEISDQQYKRMMEAIMLASSEQKVTALFEVATAEPNFFVAAHAKSMQSLFCANPMNWENWKRYMAGRIYDLLFSLYVLEQMPDPALRRELIAMTLEAVRTAEPDFVEHIVSRGETIKRTAKAAKESIQ